MRLQIRLLESPEFNFIDPEKLLTLNVSGQLFDLPVKILTRDPYSVLACCCRVDPIIQPDAEGRLFFDRDWWLFRHIVAFLRSNILPNELETLKELYVEASFFRLESLQKAIEEIPTDSLSNFSHNTINKDVTGANGQAFRVANTLGEVALRKHNV